MLDRLRAFAAAGGKVVFVGRTPTMVVDQTFLNPVPGAPDLSFATIEPTADITDKVVAALPSPDVKLDPPAEMVNYAHRTLADGDIYLFFNESAQPLSTTAALNGTGQVQIWNAADGTIHPLAGAPVANGSVAVPLNLEPWEGRFVVIGSLPANARKPWPALSADQVIASIDGNWSVTLGDKQLDTPLKSWQDLGSDSFTGIAQYHKTFTAPATLPAGQRLYLDLGKVNEVAHVKVNGTDLDSLGWTPYMWDVTDSIKPGDNTIDVQVQIAPAGGRGFGGGGGARGAATTGPSTGPAGLAGGRAGGRGRGGGGAFGAPASPPTPKGLLGPVRLFAQ
jgi:hypothetical protein